MPHPAADPFDLVERIVNGVLDADATRWVQRGFLTWIRSDGEIPLERCLHLPRTSKQLQRLRRDDAIRDAGRLLDAPTSYALAKEVERELCQFIERGPWRHWRALGAAPEQSSKLRAALFVAVKCNDGESLSVKQLQRILDKDLL
jgi:hypothetical protein